MRNTPNQRQRRSSIPARYQIATFAGHPAQMAPVHADEEAIGRGPQTWEDLLHDCSRVYGREPEQWFDESAAWGH